MVKVYIADVSSLRDEQIYRSLYESADLERRLKADSYVFQKDKMLSIGAWSLLRYALKKEGIREIFVRTHKNNKPYLVGNPNLHFNLSHSEQMVMCAIADKETGCDVEKRTAFDPALAEYVMTEDELKRIYSFKDQQEQEEMFLRLWTLKESYMKATGFGMELMPQAFGISFHEGEIRVCGRKDDREYFFKEYHLNDGYCYSCCSLSGIFCDDMIKIDLVKVHNSNKAALR